MMNPPFAPVTHPIESPKAPGRFGPVKNVAPRSLKTQRRDEMGRRVILCTAMTTLGIACAIAAESADAFKPDIPKTWDDTAIESLELPLATPRFSPNHITADYYYRIPVRPIFKSYAVYHPDQEPPDYFESLRRLDPEIIWDDKGKRPRLTNEAEWAAAGELVFDAPTAFDKGDGGRTSANRGSSSTR